MKRAAFQLVGNPIFRQNGPIRSTIVALFIAGATGLAILGVYFGNGAGLDPVRLRVGVLPDEIPESLRRRHEPLIKRLAGSLGIGYDLIIPDSYNHLVELFQQGQIDLAYFGGLTFVLANKKNGAEALVMRDIDANFTSSFLIRTDNPASELHDLKGESVAFGSKLSTSGHLMPRFHLLKVGIVPEKFFSGVNYSGAHDKTAQWVRDGKVTLGIINSHVAERLYDSGKLRPDKVRVLWKTPSYPDYVWALRKGISDDFKNKLRDAFISLTTTDSDDRKVLNSAHTSGFIPASDRDFIDLKNIAEKLGLLRSGS